MCPHDTLMGRICTNQPPADRARSAPQVAMSHIVIGDLALRWIVTMVLCVSIATYVYIVVAQRSRWTSTVNHVLHLTMSAAMILMVWRVGLTLPTTGPIIFFLLAGVWFAHLAGRVSSATSERLTNCYYAVMMGAMAWMYALMNGSLPAQTTHSPDHGHSGSQVMNMSEADMPSQEMSRTALGLGWITTVNWMVTIGFAVVAVYWPCRYFAKRRTNPVPHAAQLAHLELLFRASTAAGAALMFAVML